MVLCQKSGRNFCIHLCLRSLRFVKMCSFQTTDFHDSFSRGNFEFYFFTGILFTNSGWYFCARNLFRTSQFGIFAWGTLVLIQDIAEISAIIVRPEEFRTTVNRIKKAVYLIERWKEGMTFFVSRLGMLSHSMQFEIFPSLVIVYGKRCLLMNMRVAIQTCHLQPYSCLRAYSWSLCPTWRSSSCKFPSSDLPQVDLCWKLSIWMIRSSVFTNDSSFLIFPTLLIHL